MTSNLTDHGPAAPAARADRANDLPLPPNARVVQGEGVWMEGNAIAQFAQIAALPGCVRAVGMPDMHAGGTAPIGAVFAFDDAVRPSLLGGDVGCGVLVVVTREAGGSVDALERRARALFEGESFVADLEAPEALFAEVFRRGLRGLDAFELPRSMGELAAGLAGAADAADAEGVGADPGPYASCVSTLGSIGGGNHFAEIARVNEVTPGPLAEALGLKKGALAAVVHSGSRAVGARLNDRWGQRELPAAEAGPFLAEMAGACRFARVNRFLLAYRLLEAIGAARPSKIAGAFDVFHNAVEPASVGGCTRAWVHRKGAAPARAGEPTIVLGSRGAPSYLLAGAGNEAVLASVAHGAGRKMGRSEAKEKLRDRYRRADLTRTPLGGRVVCDDRDVLYEEHPDAYKAVGPVVRALVDHGAATPVAALTPIVTVKR
ncbi:MAG TPA: RtcB family protein [Polyangiaceae bacterium]|nr:RtcB family protein [Polyangiaceae bacterium]